MRCLRMVFSGSFALRCDELKPFGEKRVAVDLIFFRVVFRGVTDSKLLFFEKARR